MENQRPIEDFKVTEDEYERYLSGEEIWKDIPEYEGKYKISSFGKIKSIFRMEIRGNHTYKVRERILIHAISRTGYSRVTLTKNGNHKRFLVHRLIGVTFINNPENKPEINHDSGNKSENTVYNCFWSTTSENLVHAFRTGLRHAPWTNKFGKDHNASKKITQYTKKGIYIETYDSIRLAEAATGVDARRISDNALGRKPGGGGFDWRYI